MNDPSGRRAELEARNAAMREQVTSLLDGLTKQTEHLQEAQQQAVAATGEATSQDGLVTVHVNAMGIVTDVELSSSAFTRTTPEKLARSFVLTVQEAARDARGKADAAMAGAQENVPDLPDLFPQAPSLKNLVPQAPSVPDATAEVQADDDWDEDFDPRSNRRENRW